MQEKQGKNKFRDAIGDYYKTNRQVSKENPSKKGGRWEPREKAMLVSAILLTVAVVVKYLVF